MQTGSVSETNDRLNFCTNNKKKKKKNPNRIFNLILNHEQCSHIIIGPALQANIHQKQICWSHKKLKSWF